LHKPFRKLQDLIENNDVDDWKSWKVEFDRLHEFSKNAREYIDNNNDYYVGNVLEKEAKLDPELVALFEGEVVEDDVGSDDEENEFAYSDEEVPDEFRTANQEEDVVDGEADIEDWKFYGVENQNTVDKLQDYVIPKTQNRTIELTKIDDMEAFDDLLTKMEKQHENPVENPRHLNRNRDETTFLEHDIQTRVTLLKEACQSRRWFPISEVEIQEKPCKLPPCSNLWATSRYFELNFAQHEAFMISATGVLEQICYDLNPNQENPKAVYAFLGGEAGCGKSKVIQALASLNDNWMKNSVIKNDP